MPQIFKPTTLDEAVQFLAQQDVNARIVNGNTALPDEIKSGAHSPQTLIDISQIPNLDYIREDGDYIRLGARVTHAQVVASLLLQLKARPLVRACLLYDPPVRERGTIVGNIAGALPENLTIAALWALGAEVKLKSVRGERSVTFKDFFRGIRQTSAEPDEMIVEVAFSKMSPKDKGTFVSTGWHVEGENPTINIAVVLEFEDDEISNAWITLGGVAPTVVNAIDAEQALVGQWLSDAAIAEVAELAMNAVDPKSVVRPFGSEVVRELVERALMEIRDGE